MKIKLLITTLLFLIAALIFYSCDTTEPGGDPPKPPGYQEDIPWPSLADSPWPMYRADPQNTGRSKYAGASSGITAWSSEEYKLNSCVIGEDGAIYFIAVGDSSGFYAFNVDGYRKWKLPLEILPFDEEFPTPVLTSNGSIYFNDPQAKQLYALDTSGQVKWIIDNLTTSNNTSQIALDKTGNIFFLGFEGGIKNLYYISKEGIILWNIENNDFTDGMSFSPDGNTLYITGSKQSGTAFYALDLNGTIKWEFKAKIKNNFTAPITDSEGNNYVIASTDGLEYSLYSVNSKGKVEWDIFLGVQYQDANHPALDKLGNLYVGVDSLFSISVEGKINWKVKIGDPPMTLSSPVSINNNNELFYTVGYGEQKELWKMNNNGEIIWKISTPGSSYPTSSLAIGYDKIILTEIQKDYLIIIR